jgi:tetratricopeptide (TPR) repeat protein
MAARKALYRKLADYANYQHSLLLATKRENMRQDEIHFEEKFSLSDPGTFQFKDLPLTQVMERQALHTAITVFEIERMVYRLLQDPELNLNSEYITLENDNDRASRQEEDFWAQSEMWHVLHDDWLMKFVKLRERKHVRARGETPIEVLRRFAEQENVARWIKRFVLRGSADRAIEFGTEVEKAIRAWPRPDGDDEESRRLRNKWDSWNHTLAREERVIWTQLAYIRRGDDVEGTAMAIEKSIAQLEKLFKKSVESVVVSEGRHKEYGFARVHSRTDRHIPEHPAFMRLRRLLSHAHNHLGYARRTSGQMHAAVKNYGRSLEYVRADRGLMQAHRAKVLNNLSRALSELGWNSIGVCLDGRDLRWNLAEEVPLASSYNTLAIIYDDMGRYEDAPLLSAKAIAYCRRSVEDRQLGLSLRQMAESLRHVAERVRTRQRVAGVPETYLDAAEILLREARLIFEGLNQVERLVEVNLEMGSLYRDRMQPPETDETPQAPVNPRARVEFHRQALGLLSLAEKDAQTYKLGQHELDARINRARVHIFAGETDKARTILEGIEGHSDYAEHVITDAYWPNARRTELRDRNWIFRHLGTARMIRGWIAIDRFTERAEQIKLENPIDIANPDATHELRDRLIANDEVAQDALGDIAECYALGIAYAGLFSPRSRSIGTMQNDLYRRLRKFNRSELESFRAHLVKVGKKYRKLTSVSLLMLFLDEFLGPKLN